MDTTKTPREAFHFAAEVIPIAQAEEGRRRRKFGGVAYSGDPITGHWYWGTVVFDLASVRLPPKVPVLIEHDRAQRAGFASLAVRDGKLVVAEGELMANAHGRAIAEESDEGFPWQLSVHIEPGRVEEVQAGAEVEVNGRRLKGPLNVFRDSLIREISFTPTGADPQTVAYAMSAPAPAAARGALDTETQTQEEADMDPTKIEELQAQVEDLSAKLSAAEARAAEAEKALAEMKKAQRFSAVRELFASLGKEITEDEAAPYLRMEDEIFAAVAEHLKAARPKAPEHLFTEQATDGKPPAADADPTTFTAALTKAAEALSVKS